MVALEASLDVVRRSARRSPFGVINGEQSCNKNRLPIVSGKSSFPG